MDLKTKKRIAASILKCSPKRVKFNENNLQDIQDAITREDIKILIHKGIIMKEPKKGISNGRFKELREKKRKGHRKGQGSRKGTKNARDNRKKKWMIRVRLQRRFIKDLKDKGMISEKNYRNIYNKISSGFFRSLRHLKLYLNDNKLIIKKE